MTLEITLALEEMRVLWPATTRAVVRITNRGDAPIEAGNEDGAPGVAAIHAIDLETGRAAGHGPAPAPPGTTAPRSIGPGETLEERFDLSDRVRLPGAGMFALRAHVSAGGSAVVSSPARVEVVASRPRALHLLTTTGGPNGHVFGAWVHEAGASGQLWLSLLSALGEADFISTVRLADVPKAAVPVLSAPAGRAPHAQYVGWIDDAKLGVAIHQMGRVETRALDLGAPGYQLVAPLLEVPFAPDMPAHAEALLAREAPGGFQLVVARLHQDEGLGDAVAVDAPPFVWAHTLQRTDLGRSTLFFVPRQRGDERVLTLLHASWRPGGTPEHLLPVGTWAGVLLAADQRLGANGMGVGAAILDVGHEAPSYVVQRWRVLPDGRFEEGTLSRVEWPYDAPIEQAIVRVDPFGGAHALLRGGPGGRFHAWRPGGHVSPLADDLAATEAGSAPMPPADIYFLDQTDPVIVFSDPRAGLRVWSSTPRRRAISPAGLAV